VSNEERILKDKFSDQVTTLRQVGGLYRELISDLKGSTLGAVPRSLGEKLKKVCRVTIKELGVHASWR